MRILQGDVAQLGVKAGDGRGGQGRGLTALAMCVAFSADVVSVVGNQGRWAGCRRARSMVIRTSHARPINADTGGKVR